MLLKDISFESPEENILFDHVLLHLAEKGKQSQACLPDRQACLPDRQALRFWESPKTFIVLGRISNPLNDLCLDQIEEEKIPVLRRFSGGGTVVQGKGCLNYSLVLSKEAHPEIISLHKSYQFILGKIIVALSTLGVDAFFRPISDMAVATPDGQEKKISGNAQQRGRKFILHHGTILYDFSLPLISRYLKIPQDMPEYRQRRSHEAFVANVNVPILELKKAIKKVFSVESQDSRLSVEERVCLDEFLKTKEVQVDLKLL